MAYVATGVWHHYLVTGDRAFLDECFPWVSAAIDFVLRYQSADGEIAWAVNDNGEAQDDALLTACCSVARSLDCAVAIADTLDSVRPAWRRACARLVDAIANKPERFDRTWPSKARFAMDWYYPILAGLHAPAAARARLRARWEEFVVPAYGCRCVNDEPWVTMAETAELVIALAAAGAKQTARELFNTLAQWQDTDGGYWTGYVYRDRALWPAEKTTWTAAAVLLAGDAVCNDSPAARLFLTPVDRTG